MKTAAEVVKEYIANNPRLSKRAKLCKACGKHYDVEAGHECELTAAQLAEYGQMTEGRVE